jgi:hypothetical protein
MSACGTGMCRQVSVKLSNFHGNPFSDSRIVTCEQTDGQTGSDDKADRRTLGANAPKPG